MENYDVIIGLEIHIQTNTNSKMFCPCSADYFEKSPNTQTCPVCLGLPGALPVPNKKAIEKCILFGLATNSKITDNIRFDRKHYFYPDLPKGYQISQHDNPICYDGYLTVEDEEGNETKVEIERIHQEEDVAKSLHIDNYTLIDYNKSGLALIEIVSKPLIRDAYVAKEYASKIRQIVRYLNISNADMEKGQMRCEPNISLQKKGTWKYDNGKIVPEKGYKLNPKVEIKNIGSISAVEKSIQYEIQRMKDEIENQGELVQQTRGWNSEKNTTEYQRSKETADDYRYFPEPDIPVIELNQEDIEKIKEQLVELPDTKVDRYVNEYKLSKYDAKVITASKNNALFFEKLLSKIDDAKVAANWLTGPIFSYLNKEDIGIDELNIDLDDLATLIKKVENKDILKNKAEELLNKSLDEKIPLKELLEESSGMISDSQELESFAKQVIEENPNAVEDYKNGKTNAISFLIGQLMKLTKGSANPEIAKKLLEELIKKE